MVTWWRHLTSFPKVHWWWCQPGCVLSTVLQVHQSCKFFSVSCCFNANFPNSTKIPSSSWLAWQWQFISHRPHPDGNHNCDLFLYGCSLMIFLLDCFSLLVSFLNFTLVPTCLTVTCYSHHLTGWLCCGSCRLDNWKGLQFSVPFVAAGRHCRLAPYLPTLELICHLCRCVSTMPENRVTSGLM